MSLEKIEQIRAKFRSGNDIPVERAVVLADEWKAVEAELTRIKDLTEANGYCEWVGPGRDGLVDRMFGRLAQVEACKAIAERYVWGAMHNMKRRPMMFEGRPVGGVLWAFVSDALGVGSTTAMRLCRDYGMDPHEQVSFPALENEEMREP